MFRLPFWIFGAFAKADVAEARTHTYTERDCRLPPHFLHGTLGQGDYGDKNHPASKHTEMKPSASYWKAPNGSSSSGDLRDPKMGLLQIKETTGNDVQWSETSQDYDGDFFIIIVGGVMPYMGICPERCPQGETKMIFLQNFGCTFFFLSVVNRPISTSPGLKKKTVWWIVNIRTSALHHHTFHHIIIIFFLSWINFVSFFTTTHFVQM